MSKINTTKSGAYTKSSMIEHIANLKPNQNFIKYFEPIAYKSTGSSYGACGIRIDGNPVFIDAVLSRLKDILLLENDETRLELARRKVEPSDDTKARIAKGDIKGIKKETPKAAPNAEVMYIRVHHRGIESKMAHAFLNAMRGEDNE